MARYFDIHPASPQQRTIVQVADIVRAGGVIAYPTDSCYALGCQLGSIDGITRIRSIRHLDDRHLWVPITSSTSSDQVIFVDQAADTSVSSDAVQVEVDGLG